LTGSTLELSAKSLSRFELNQQIRLEMLAETWLLIGLIVALAESLYCKPNWTYSTVELQPKPGTLQSTVLYRVTYCTVPGGSSIHDWSRTRKANNMAFLFWTVIDIQSLSADNAEGVQSRDFQRN